MTVWVVGAWDHLAPVPGVWQSTPYHTLWAALLQAAWLTERDRLLGCGRVFTVTEARP